MKKILKGLLTSALCLALAAASSNALAETGAPKRAVALLGSFAEAWVLAGGTLAGTTEDAVSERSMALDDGVEIIGSTQEPNLERILDLEPELVIYSLATREQVDIARQLEDMGVKCLGFTVNHYSEYLEMMRTFCTLNGRDDLYAAQAEQVEVPIQALIARAKADARYGTRTALMLRAFSTGVKAKGSDNLAGAMLQDMGLVNIADSEDTLMENLTLEAIIEADPDYIFVVTMGSSEQKAMAAVAEMLSDNPAWSELTAVRENRYIVLDRTLFHYKPNARWAESYQYLWDLLYGQ